MVNFTPSTDLQAHERKHTEKTLQELIDIIHFTETVSAKVHGSEDVVAIFQAVKAEFVKSKKYGMGIYLLTDDGKLRLAESTISPTIFTKISNVVGISLNSYTIDLDKSTFFSRVVKGGETIQANFGDIMSELLPSAVAYLVGKVTGLHNEGTAVPTGKDYGRTLHEPSHTSRILHPLCEKPSQTYFNSSGSCSRKSQTQTS
jgi:hypothetical protein